MFNLFKKKEKFKSPVSGKLIPLAAVNDQVFSQKMMGDGFAIIPSDTMIYAPISGEVTMLFPTKHAVGVKTKTGVEFIIHIGLDTVELNGEGFKTYIQQGQKINQGDKLVEFNDTFIKSKGYDATVIIVFPNNDVKINEKTMTISNLDDIDVEL